MTNFIKKIKENNATHSITEEELFPLMQQASAVFQKHFSPETWFERSIFINWTCAIADCKYCYLSTKKKYNVQQGTKAVRSKASILAEALLCKKMGWKVGYITGGLRVEKPEYLIDLAQQISVITEEKIMMNFGPYSKPMIERFQPYISGMGAAIESFHPELHHFICPSKPLKTLLQFLEDLRSLELQKLITIILGMGESKEDVFTVIENVKKYGIEKVQLCFLKPQAGTVFAEVPPPDVKYMAFWVAHLRIACPELQIKVALVKERIKEMSLLLKAGANSFTRFFVFKEFASPVATELQKECEKTGRTLLGHFAELPKISWEEEVACLSYSDELRQQVLHKVKQYWKKLQLLSSLKRENLSSERL